MPTLSVRLRSLRGVTANGWIKLSIAEAAGGVQNCTSPVQRTFLNIVRSKSHHPYAEKISDFRLSIVRTNFDGEDISTASQLGCCQPLCTAVRVQRQLYSPPRLSVLHFSVDVHASPFYRHEPLPGGGLQLFHLRRIQFRIVGLHASGQH